MSERRQHGAAVWNRSRWSNSVGDRRVPTTWRSQAVSPATPGAGLHHAGSRLVGRGTERRWHAQVGGATVPEGFPDQIDYRVSQIS